jgi:diguanylate cyclase (GGDEF)-like protein
VENLKDGREITIIFIDLDDFGLYNKKYGHIVGDRVLQKVADMIQERIEPASDLLVRYGGDEFAIGTVRAQEDSADLARSLQEGMSLLRVAGSDEPVNFSIGVQGGKRTKERENVHYAATLDNLINLASKRSMAEKAAKKGSPGPAAAAPAPPEPISPETKLDLAEAHGDVPPYAAQPDSEPEAMLDTEPQAVATEAPPSHAVIEEPVLNGPLRIGDVVADATDANSVTQVSIVVGSRTVTGICPRKGGSVTQSVAYATANAISQLRPEIKIDIREVNLTESETGVRFISVIGTSTVNGEEQPIGGVGTVGRNLNLTVAEATLQAFTNYEAIQGGK